MKKNRHIDPAVALTAATGTVTYTREADGNLVKVRRAAPCPPAASRASKSRAPTEPAAKPRRALKPPCDAGWTLPIEPVVRAVAESVAARHGVSVEAMIRGERFRRTVRARHEWWRLVKDTWDLSYPETGRVVGGVDHTSIMYALRASESVSTSDDKSTTHSKKMSPNDPLRTL
jgi:hypothetical protein